MAARCEEQLARATAPGKGSGWEKLLAACTLQTVRASAMSMTRRDTLYSGFTERARRALPREWKDPKESPYSFSYPARPRDTRIVFRVDVENPVQTVTCTSPGVPPAKRYPPGARLPSPIRQPTCVNIPRVGIWKMDTNATGTANTIADTRVCAN